MANKVRRFHTASLAALLLCGCQGETVSPVPSDLKPAKSLENTPKSTQAKVALFVDGITQDLGFYY